MTIETTFTQELENVIEQESAKYASNQQFKDLEGIIEELEEKGLIKKPSYTLPLVDTIGRTHYNVKGGKSLIFR